jgi:hypothetical protein
MNLSTAEAGRRAVRDRLHREGWTTRERRVGHRLEVEAWRHGRRRSVRVSTKRSGTWQTSTSYGEPRPAEEDPERFWVLVDLGGPAPVAYVVPEWWLVNDIHEVHAGYLARHGGTRPVTRTSTHHAIAPARVRSWRERWDLLG